VARRGSARLGKVPNGQFLNTEVEMIERKWDIEVDAVWDAIGSYHKGQVVPWSVVETAMGRNRDDVGGWSIIKRVRSRLLRRRRIATRPEVNTGLRLLTDLQAATEVPADRQRRAGRQIARGLRETAVVDVANLPRATSVALAASRRYMKAQRSEIARSQREVETLLRPTQRNAR
jgi:hypothetical protein